MAGLALVSQEGDMGTMGVPHICILLSSPQTSALTLCNDSPYEFVEPWTWFYLSTLAM